MSANVAGEVSMRGAAAHVREAAALFAISAAMVGGTYATSFAATRMGLPVSRSLIFEGRWLVPSFSRFPWAYCAGMLLFMVALPLLWERLRGVPAATVGFRLTPASALLSATAAAFALAVWLIRRGSAYASWPGAAEGKPWLLLAYFLVVAIAEETAFRGIIQRRLADMTGPYASLVIASAVFALWHGVPQDVAQLAIRFAAGIILGVFYQHTRTLLIPSALHWAFDVTLSVV